MALRYDVEEATVMEEYCSKFVALLPEPKWRARATGDKTNYLDDTNRMILHGGGAEGQTALRLAEFTSTIYIGAHYFLLIPSPCLT